MLQKISLNPEVTFNRPYIAFFAKKKQKKDKVETFHKPLCMVLQYEIISICNIFNVILTSN